MRSARACSLADAGAKDVEFALKRQPASHRHQRSAQTHGARRGRHRPGKRSSGSAGVHFARSWPTAKPLFKKPRHAAHWWGAPFALARRHGKRRRHRNAAQRHRRRRAHTSLVWDTRQWCFHSPFSSLRLFILFFFGVVTPPLSFLFGASALTNSHAMERGEGNEKMGAHATRTYRRGGVYTRDALRPVSTP